MPRSYGLTRPPQVGSWSMAERNMEISVVIPTLNEADNLQILLPRLQTVLDKLGCDYEVIIADGASKDGTLDIARQYGTSIIRKKKGYGIALRSAFRQCHGKFVITMDADLSHNPSIIKQLYLKRHAADIVIASRYIRRGSADASFIRKILSIILNKIFCIFLALPLKDVSSGFRLYNSEILKRLKLKGHHYEILQEILIKAYLRGCTVTEIPFRYLPRGSGRSHVHLLTFGFYYMKVLFKFWKQRNFIIADHKKFKS